jgi:hypothetical protein
MFTPTKQIIFFIFSENDPLKRTGRLFGGVIGDIDSRWRFYLSDFTDGFNLTCVAAISFIFFAALSAAVILGNLTEEKTGGLIGIPETLVSTSISGCLFALFSGQPLVIVGALGTGNSKKFLVQTAITH